MKILKKVMMNLLIVISMLTLASIGASAEWKEDSNGDWRYSEGNSYASGWTNIDGNWYWFYSGGGRMVHDQWIDGYYLDSNGAWTKTANYVTSNIDKDGIITGQSGQKYGRAGSEGYFPVVNGEPCLYTMDDNDSDRYIGLNTLNIYDGNNNIVDSAKLL